MRICIGGVYIYIFYIYYILHNCYKLHAKFSTINDICKYTDTHTYAPCMILYGCRRRRRTKARVAFMSLVNILLGARDVSLVRSPSRYVRDPKSAQSGKGERTRLPHACLLDWHDNTARNTHVYTYAYACMRAYTRVIMHTRRSLNPFGAFRLPSVRKRFVFANTNGPRLRAPSFFRLFLSHTTLSVSVPFRHPGGDSPNTRRR